MATNITRETVNVIQTLVHDAFDTNSILDRAKTILNAKLAFPIFSEKVHILAHKYSMDMGDGIGDLIEAYNEPIEYGNIEPHIENYESVLEVINKVYDSVITFQNELNQGAKIAYDNMDIHIFEGLMNIIEKHNKYVEQVILWKDITEKYMDNPSLDVRIEKYDILGV